jgi:hypothetical protein
MLMADAATPHSSRIRAALGVFGIAREGLNLDMETRVSALERAAQEAQNKRSDGMASEGWCCGSIDEVGTPIALDQG